MTFKEHDCHAISLIYIECSSRWRSREDASSRDRTLAALQLPGGCRSKNTSQPLFWYLRMRTDRFRVAHPDGIFVEARLHSFIHGNIYWAHSICQAVNCPRGWRCKQDIIGVLEGSPSGPEGYVPGPETTQRRKGGGCQERFRGQKCLVLENEEHL